ncbi:MAG: serine protease [Candidatus Vogelbacteria bacterium]|nr:serine protease [Candidatus Vogelbacteria bacterium]
MDIRDLNKTQFLLVVFLVMLMTAAVTAIITIALFDQTQGSFGGKMDNVVVRTIDRIVPGATTTIVRIIKEVPTPLPNQGEMIAQAVESSLPSLVQLQNKTEKGVENIGTGVAVSGQLIATASRLLPAEAKDITIVFPKATSQASIIYRDESGVAFLRMVATTTNLVPFAINASSTSNVGHTSISLVLAENNTPDIVTGLILGTSELVSNATASSSLAQEVLRTSSVTERNVGGPVLNEQGNLIGIGISRGYALSIKSLKALIDQLK